MMHRLLPFPLVALALLAFWLLLNQSLAPAQILLGAGLAVVSGMILTAVAPGAARCKRPGVLAVLGWLVLQDIVRSNIAVARIILGPRGRSVTSDFVDIPLELKGPAGLASLAMIITATPGTVWVRHDPRSGILTIHVLDLVDRATWIRTIKDRYERRLKEIFE
jgi:multicomponent K+:H+ antiporter subunit E